MLFLKWQTAAIIQSYLSVQRARLGSLLVAIEANCRRGVATVARTDVVGVVIIRTSAGQATVCTYVSHNHSSITSHHTQKTHVSASEK